VTFVEYARLTSPECGALGQDAVGLIHLGSVEQHGPHLPLITDAALAAELSQKLARRFRNPIVVMPTIPFGLSDHHLGFAGTITVSATTLTAVIEAFVRGLRSAGVHRVAVFSAHGGNFGLLAELDERGRIDDVEVVCFADFDGFERAMATAGRSAGLDPLATDIHAGLLETSAVLALMEESVRPFDQVQGYVAGDDGWLNQLVRDGTRSLHESGVLGDPRGAHAQAGALILDALVDLLERWLTERFQLTPVPA
jgi:creatinine amidohydrolase